MLSKVQKRDFQYYRHLQEKIQFLDLLQKQREKEVQNYQAVLKILAEE